MEVRAAVEHLHYRLLLPVMYQYYSRVALQQPHGILDVIESTGMMLHEKAPLERKQALPGLVGEQRAVFTGLERLGIGDLRPALGAVAGDHL